MLENLTTLDVRKLKAWQLDEALAIWQDFRDRKFQSFHQCAVAKLRTLLASDPSIHGSKKPELPT